MWSSPGALLWYQADHHSAGYNPPMPQSISVQGCSLSFAEQGSGEPVVFIQGVGLHGEGWRPQTNVLQTAYRCVSFDNRGIGASQPLTGKLTLEQMATDTLAVMDAAGIASAHLVGHSLGGCIAQQLALAFPSRVKSLALLCTSARGADATDLRWPMFLVGLRCHVGTAAMRRRAFLEIVMSRTHRATHDADKTAAELAPLFGHDLGMSPPGVMKQLAALKTFDARARLNRTCEIPRPGTECGRGPHFPASLRTRARARNCRRALRRGREGCAWCSDGICRARKSRTGVPSAKCWAVGEVTARFGSQLHGSPGELACTANSSSRSQARAQLTARFILNGFCANWRLRRGRHHQSKFCPFLVNRVMSDGRVSAGQPVAFLLTTSGTPPFGVSAQTKV
jgi:pimeloyl-ACP methyl ester carboxylesterase